MTALMPLNCWKNIKPKTIMNTFKCHLANVALSLFLTYWSSSISLVTSHLLPLSHWRDTLALRFFFFEMYHLGVSGTIHIATRNGIDKSAPIPANPLHSTKLPEIKQIKMPKFPNAVGKRPNLPLILGCRVSAKYTGRAKEVMPTLHPLRILLAYIDQ